MVIVNFNWFGVGTVGNQRGNGSQIGTGGCAVEFKLRCPCLLDNDLSGLGTVAESIEVEAQLVIREFSTPAVRRSVCYGQSLIIHIQRDTILVFQMELRHHFAVDDTRPDVGVAIVEGAPHHVELPTVGGDAALGFGAEKIGVGGCVERDVGVAIALHELERTRVIRR